MISTFNLDTRRPDKGRLFLFIIVRESMRTHLPRLNETGNYKKKQLTIKHKGK